MSHHSHKEKTEPKKKQNGKFMLKKDKYDARDYIYLCGLNAQELPKSLDLRPLAPAVYDQGEESSCSANAGCAARTMLAKDPELYLSRAFLYYNERLIGGNTAEDCGASVRDIVKAAAKYGICLDGEMPYRPGDFATAPTKENYDAAEQYKIGSYSRIGGITALRQALFTRYQPVLIGMEIFGGMEDMAAGTGVLPLPSRGERSLGGHAVLAVGYTDELPRSVAERLPPKSILARLRDFVFGKKTPSGYLILRNSWGEQWGDGGYFYMPYEYVEAGYAFDFWIME